MKSFITLAVLATFASANGGIISPYFGHHGYAPYVPIIRTLAPKEAELKVETIEPPKEVQPIIAPLVPHYPVPHVAPHALHYAAGYGYPASSQFHAQDEFGNLKFGYSNINSAKHEHGNTYGGVAGGYQYVDANGVLQSVSYVADGLGFRTVDSRLPIAPEVPETEPLVQPEAPIFEGEQIPDTPEVAAAKEEFQKAYDAAEAASDE
ncbi:cuticle protein 6 [Lepeophtheirus salmonis]|uniref:Cuticle protein 6 n=1 Tax=Lepeophtheirus salmonis TaxID=72036 RepID=D3PHI2_LEPSM|nr:cuticle protein 6-like [Lepeophtheirus salmonis]ADD38018.1 Cuticle protein 6 [Lepeophtheirus salmonis]